MLECPEHGPVFSSVFYILFVPESFFYKLHDSRYQQVFTDLHL